MKNKKLKLWLVRIVFFALLPILLVAVLYFTNNLDAFIDKTNKKLTKLSFLSVVVYIFLFVLDIIKGWASKYISDIIFPGELKKIGQDVNQTKKIAKKVKADTSLIIEKQKKQEKKIKDIYEQRNLDPRLIKRYLEDLKNFVTAKEKEKEIENWYLNNTITPKEKEILLLIIDHQKETIQVFNKRTKQLQLEGNNEFAKALKNITIYLQKGNSEEIRNNYFKYVKKQKEANIELLKSSIYAAKQLFAYNEIKELYKELIKLEPSHSNHFDFAFSLQKFNFFDEAISHYEEALKICRELAKENPRTYLPDVATTLNNLANLHSAKNEFPQALEKYEEALKICRELAKENPRTYLPDVATTLNNLAILHSDKNEFPQALKKYEEALKIRRELAKENLRTYLPDVATTLNNLANLHSAKNEFPQALEKYEEALKIYRELAKENPRTYLPDVAITLNNLAGLHSAKNEFPQALEKYEEALKIRRELAKENPRTYLPDVAITLNNLAVLHSAKNEFPQALEKYEEALKIYRELAKENPRTYEIDYARMLIMGVNLFNKNKDSLKEARSILKKYKKIYRANKLIDIIEKPDS